ncbi:MAG: deoxyguanosinetriphosphate triphosphohydrolase, partial [Bdellovibrionales bacterium]
DIAYNNHDVEDGLRAKMFTLKDIEDVPLLGRQLKKIQSSYDGLPKDILIAELIRDMIGEMVTDVYDETCLR